jgi:hypothetical protein
MSREFKNTYDYDSGEIFFVPVEVSKRTEGKG